MLEYRDTGQEWLGKPTEKWTNRMCLGAMVLGGWKDYVEERYVWSTGKRGVAVMLRSLGFTRGIWGFQPLVMTQGES